MRLALTVCLLIAPCLFAQGSNPGPYTYKVLYQFGTATDTDGGVSPGSSLILGYDGNFYGTTQTCVNSDCYGTFFQVTPQGAVTTLHEFTGGADGSSPNGALAIDNAGNIYGTTGGNTAYTFSRDGVYTSFGYLPQPTPFGARPTGLIYASDGNLYGTDSQTYNLFRVTPAGDMTLLVQDGAGSLFIQGPDGALYGVGAGAGAGFPGVGLPFVRLTLDGTLSLVANISTAGGGFLPPYPTPVLGSDGSFYLVGRGVVVKVSPSGTVTAPKQAIGGWDFGTPMILGSDGNIYLISCTGMFSISTSLEPTLLLGYSTCAFGTPAGFVQGAGAFYVTSPDYGSGAFTEISGGGTGGTGGGATAPPAPKANGKNLGNPSNVPGGFSRGDPISAANGNMFDEVTDYQTTGPNQLRFIRYYNSLTAATAFAVTLGSNWRSNYDRYLRIASASSVTAERADGQQVVFTLTNGAWTTDTDIDLKLTNSGSTWTLTDQNDTVETYSAGSGSAQALLQSIRARNGYTQTLQYASGASLTAVTDSFSRRLSFTYSGGRLQTVTTPDGLVLTYGYTGAQLTSVGYSTSPPTHQTYLYEPALPSALTGIIDENGNRIATWTYDSSGRALSSQNVGGANLTRVSYNDTDGSRTITNALGEQEVWKFTTLQGVPKVTEIDREASGSLLAASAKFTYDSNGYTASLTDWNGNLTTFVNDAHGQPTTINLAVGTPQTRTTTTTYHASFHLPVKIVTPGLTTTFTYDANGELLTKTFTDTTTTSTPYSTGGQTRTWTYTWSNFLPASEQSPRTDLTAVTKYTYDSTGALTGSTNALGQTTKITQHLPGGLPQTIVDPNGVTTTLTYDARLRLLSSTVATAAGPLTTAYTYDAAGNRISAALPDGSALTNTYDAAYRLMAITDLFNQTIAYTLDALGDRTSTNVTASGAVQRMHSGKFDALGRQLRDIGGAGQTTTYTYDSNGNMLTLTDPLSHAAQRTFDALNRLIAVTDPAGGVTTTSYDAHDRPVSVTDPNGGATTYVYDGFGDLIQSVSPDSGTTVYHYDLNGNRTQTIDGTGAIANYTFDALDRVKTASYPADAAENVTYTYDQGSFGIGHLTAVADAPGTLTRSYDERGNMLSETRVNGTAKLATAYTYDAADRVASIAYPSGWTAVYTRDAMGRTTAVTAQAPGGGASTPVLSSIGYQPFGAVNGMMFGNGVAETRSFDLDYRVTALADAGTALLQNLTYAYDAAGNVLSITDGVTSASSQTLGYDALNRLTSATGSYGTYMYMYDAVGNRVGESVKVGPVPALNVFGYAPQSNQLTSIIPGSGKEIWGYDKAGNLASFSPALGGITNLTYNQAGRLATAMSGRNAIAQYTYDAFGQRLAKVGASTTLYQYDQGAHLLEETDGQGNALVDYIYLGAISRASWPVATISPASGQFYFLHDDRLGTPQVGSDSNGNVAWLPDYGPFGELSAIPSLIVQNLRLPGQEFDSDTGFYHNGFRDYMPGVGRYLESDPIGLAGGLNTYGYAGANPAGAVDPSGLRPEPVETFNEFLARTTKRPKVIPGALDDSWTVAEALSELGVIQQKVRAAPKSLSYLNVGLDAIQFGEEQDLRSGADLAYSAVGLLGLVPAVGGLIAKYGTEPLAEYDLHQAYNSLNAYYGLNYQGLSRLDLFINDPVSAIKAEGAQVLGDINGQFRIPPPSDSNGMYRSAPAAFAGFH